MGRSSGDGLEYAAYVILASSTRARRTRAYVASHNTHTWNVPSGSNLSACIARSACRGVGSVTSRVGNLALVDVLAARWRAWSDEARGLVFMISKDLRRK